MYTLKQIEDLNNSMHENFSVVYPLIKDRLNEYTDYEVPFKEEFLFFENKYLPIAIDLMKSNNELPIIDIGCQYGFQSEFFKNYTGIDIYKHRFFNANREDVQYIVDDFMNSDIDLTGKVVLSIMSLGYFNHYISKELSEREVDKLIVEKLSKTNKLYIATTNNLNALLEKEFKTKKLIYNANDHAYIKSDKRKAEGISKFSVYLYEK